MFVLSHQLFMMFSPFRLRALLLLVNEIFLRAKRQTLLRKGRSQSLQRADIMFGLI